MNHHGLPIDTFAFGPPSDRRLVRLWVGPLKVHLGDISVSFPDALGILVHRHTHAPAVTVGVRAEHQPNQKVSNLFLSP